MENVITVATLIDYSQILVIGMITIFAPFIVALVLGTIREGYSLKKELLVDEVERLVKRYLLIPLIVITFSYPLLPLPFSYVYIPLLVISATVVASWKSFKSFGKFIRFTKNIAVLLIPHIERIAKQKDTELIRETYTNVFKGLDDVPHEDRKEVIDLFIQCVNEKVERGKFENAVQIAEASQYYEGDTHHMGNLFDNLLAWYRSTPIPQNYLLEGPINKYIQNLSERELTHLTLFKSLDDFTQKVKGHIESTDNQDIQAEYKSLLESILRKTFNVLLQKVLDDRHTNLSSFPGSWKIRPETVSDIIPGTLLHIFLQENFYPDGNKTFDRGKLVAVMFPGTDQRVLSLFYKMICQPTLQGVLESESLLFFKPSFVFVNGSQEDAENAFEENEKKEKEQAVNLIYEILASYTVPIPTLNGSEPLTLKENGLKKLKDLKEAVDSYKTEGGEEKRFNVETNKRALIKMINVLIGKLTQEQKG